MLFGEVLQVSVKEGASSGLQVMHLLRPIDWWGMWMCLLVQSLREGLTPMSVVRACHHPPAHGWFLDAASELGRNSF